MSEPNPYEPPAPWPHGVPPAQPWIGGGSPARRQPSIWNGVGLAVGAVLVVIGLFAIAAFVFVMVGLNNWGNNK